MIILLEGQTIIHYPCRTWYLYGLVYYPCYEIVTNLDEFFFMCTEIHRRHPQYLLNDNDVVNYYMHHKNCMPFQIQANMMVYGLFEIEM